MIRVLPEEVDGLWPSIQIGLDRVLDRVNRDWEPKDVYVALLEETSILYLFENNEGFVVLTINSSFKGSTLFIWCFYSPTHTNAPAKYWPEIQQIARDIGVKKVQFASPRKGWEKMFKPITTVYEGEV